MHLIKAKADVFIVNFEEEEDRIRDAVRLLVHKYQNLFKYLFDKYTAIGLGLKKKSIFETVSDRTIKFGEC